MVQKSRDRTEYVEISGTNAERLAFDAPQQAMEWYETDTTARYKYVSGNWVQIVATGGIAPGYGSGGGGGGGAVTIVDGGDVTQGAKADTRATWYDSVVSVVSLLKLMIATYVGAGSHVYTYTNGLLTSDAWTLFGTTRTKTYSYTNGLLTSVTDWV